MNNNSNLSETNEVTKNEKSSDSYNEEINSESISSNPPETPKKGIKKLIHKFKTDKKLWIICGASLVAIIVITIIAVSSYLTSMKYIANKVFENCGAANCSYNSERKSLTIDTNDLDINPDNMTTSQYYMYYSFLEDTYDAIKYVNKELGFDSSLYKDMMSTSAIMGRQHEENDKYEVTWSYHPARGLEIEYKKK